MASEASGKIVKTAIIGASGYTGAELVRLLEPHPNFELTYLIANSKAGQSMSSVFPHLRILDLPSLILLEEADFSQIDFVFCALPHGTSQEVIKSLPKHLKIVDLSADFRLRDLDAYKKWYNLEHSAPELQSEAVYGLPEHYAQEIAKARLVAATGCNAATGNLPLIPLLKAQVIDPHSIVIDLATGVSGAGRSAKEGMLHSEVSEGFHAYGIASHRHLSEFDQELSKAAGQEVRVRFTPHLLPQNRGILATIYVQGDAQNIHSTLQKAYENAPFVEVLPFGEAPHTRHVRGSNFAHIGVCSDRVEGHAIVFCALDNLVKGSAGMAAQCANLMLGIDEKTGLMQAPIFP